MIKQPKKNIKSLALTGQRLKWFFQKLPQNILLKYNIGVEIGILSLGGVISAFILTAFIFDKPSNNAESLSSEVVSVSLSKEKIDELNEWIEARESGRGDRQSILTRSLFD